MNKGVEQIAEQLGIELKGERPVVNGVQLGRRDLEGLVEYDAAVNPSPEEAADLPVLTKESNPQKFVPRAERVRGRRRWTKLPHSHSRNYPVVTGQSVKETPDFFVKTIEGRGRHITLIRRPNIPTWILKAPPKASVEKIDLGTDELPSEDQSLVSDEQPTQLPEGVTLGPNGHFNFGELVNPKVLEQIGQ